MIEDVTANNYLLPLDGEEWATTPLEAQVRSVYLGWEKAPVYQYLRDEWLYLNFRRMKYADLKRSLQALGMLCPRSRDQAAMMLTKYFWREYLSA